ncbi:HDOD domain-containing protein [Thermostilla marina]
MDLEKLIGNAQLPALPQSAIRLLELSQDPETGPAEFAVPIESDPGLAGQVLRFVNSSYFGFSREISSVKLAITLVGMRTIKNFALWSAVFSLMPSPRCGPFDLKSLWQDSLRRALFARHVGQLANLQDAEELFAAALLQDMAIPLLAKEAPEPYTALLNARQEGKRRLSVLEQSVFGWSHATAAAMMARQWNLPDGFIALVESHPQLSSELSLPEQIVALSALLPACSDPEWADRELFAETYAGLSGCNLPDIPTVLSTVDEDFSEVAPMLKIAIPKKSLCDIYEEATVAPTEAG